ncbi:MAG: LemA family protein [Parvularculaceae bacterium]
MALNGWSDIDVQLKRRADLIPQLANVRKGYVAHERALFEEISQLRSAALLAGDDCAGAQRGRDWRCPAWSGDCRARRGLSRL